MMAGLGVKQEAKLQRRLRRTWIRLRRTPISGFGLFQAPGAAMGCAQEHAASCGLCAITQTDRLVQERHALGVATIAAGDQPKQAQAWDVVWRPRKSQVKSLLSALPVVSGEQGRRFAEEGLNIVHRVSRYRSQSHVKRLAYFLHIAIWPS